MTIQTKYDICINSSLFGNDSELYKILGGWNMKRLLTIVILLLVMHGSTFSSYAVSESDVSKSASIDLNQNQTSDCACKSDPINSRSPNSKLAQATKEKLEKNPADFILKEVEASKEFAMVRSIIKTDSEPTYIEINGTGILTYTTYNYLNPKSNIFLSAFFVYDLKSKKLVESFILEEKNSNLNSMTILNLDSEVREKYRNNKLETTEKLNTMNFSTTNEDLYLEMNLSFEGASITNNSDNIINPQVSEGCWRCLKHEYVEGYWDYECLAWCGLGLGASAWRILCAGCWVFGYTHCIDWEYVYNCPI